MSRLYASLVRRAINQATRLDSETLILQGKCEVRLRFQKKELQYVGTWSSPDETGTFLTTEEFNRCVEVLRMKHKLLRAWSEVDYE